MSALTPQAIAKIRARLETVYAEIVTSRLRHKRPGRPPRAIAGRRAAVQPRVSRIGLRAEDAVLALLQMRVDHVDELPYVRQLEPVERDHALRLLRELAQALYEAQLKVSAQ